MSDLPDAIAAVHAASLREPDGPLDITQHALWFAYRRPGDTPFGLALVRGAVAVPTIGQTVTLWTKDVPLRVVDVVHHYGCRSYFAPDRVEPYADVTVYVDVPK